MNDEIEHGSLWQANSLRSLHLTRHVGEGFVGVGVSVCVCVSLRADGRLACAYVRLRVYMCVV